MNANSKVEQAPSEVMRTGVLLVGALMLVTAVGGLVVWTGTEHREPVTATPHVDAAMPEPVKVVETPGIMHADVYFDSKSTRLRADGARVLQRHAALMSSEDGPWVVLIHGYTDRHGSAGYNRILAERRAEGVKRFLAELGVPETSMKVVTIGQEGALCDDPGAVCQSLNRRVHLEMRRMPAPVAASTDAIVER
jgi:peptidoglycan-associated lipoprotein